MKNVGIYFATKYGQTAKIAREIANTLEKSGVASAVYDVNTLSKSGELGAHDSYIFCGAMYAGKYSRKLVKLISDNRDILSKSPSAFVSLSLSAAGNETQKTEARAVAQKLLRELNWQPTHLFDVAGAVAYTKYGFLTRMVMKHICRKSGGPVDTSVEHELTDWNAVREFAKGFARR